MEIPFHQSNREKTKDDIRIKVLNVIEVSKINKRGTYKKGSVIFSTPHHKLALNWPVSIFCVA